MIQSLINIFLFLDEHFVNNLNEIESYISTNLENSSNVSQVKNIIRLISWITKSLIVKGSDKAEIWTDKVINSLLLNGCFIDK